MQSYFKEKGRECLNCERRLSVLERLEDSSEQATLKCSLRTGHVGHVCYPSTLETEAGRMGVQSDPQQSSELASSKDE